jgi:bifunctional UDP-N-acetylglucosamine pyrophosphorylase / glucosamine-1-phosphate N-acetyltransferase
LTETVKNLSVVVLAAGMGKRMKSGRPKVLHEICFKPILYYILSAVYKLNPKNVYVVVGFMGDDVIAYLNKNFPDTVPVYQKKQLGTADAVASAESYREDFAQNCLVLPGDTPLITEEILMGIVNHKLNSGCHMVAVSSIVKNPYGYGRIIKDKNGSFLKIVEEADANDGEKDICEINSSIYCFETALLFKYLKEIKPDNSQNEFYLTDIVERFIAKNNRVEVFTLKDSSMAEGFNDMIQLAGIEKYMQSRINCRHMLSGVRLRDPLTIFIDPEAHILNNTIIEPHCFIRGSTNIGKDCIIGPFTQMENSTIGNGTAINKSVVIDSIIGADNNIGPNSYIRPGTITHENVKIGACCEIKKSIIGKNSKVPHLSYIGDAEIGEDVNVGAATVTCNYDGFFKNKTVIQDGVFIGSDTMLVAPVTVGKGAITAAGSVITQDVPPHSIAIERNRQENIENGAVKFRKNKEKIKKDKK